MRAPAIATACLAAAFFLSLGEGRLTWLVWFLFLQNVSFTFVSRGRNSGSLAYHLVAAVFSNGLYAANLFFSIDLVSRGAVGPQFVATYCLATLSGSVLAHWVAMRVERGRGRNVQQDALRELEERVREMEARWTT